MKKLVIEIYQGLVNSVVAEDGSEIAVFVVDHNIKDPTERVYPKPIDKVPNIEKYLEQLIRGGNEKTEAKVN